MQERVDRHNTKIRLIRQNIPHLKKLNIAFQGRGRTHYRLPCVKCDCAAYRDYKDRFSGYVVGNNKHHSFHANTALITK